MRHGCRSQPIPPDLLDKLGERERVINAEYCWSLNRVAAALVCYHSAVQNWVSRGCLLAAFYDTGRWWIPASAIQHLV